MEFQPTRRSANFLPMALLALVAWTSVTFLTGPSSSKSFLAASPSSSVRGRTVMNSFKDDFDAWRETLSEEERSLLLKQAQGEFNKKFRKSDDFKKDLPQEKVKEFGKILTKFFDAEAEDYKKEQMQKESGGRLQMKNTGGFQGFGLKYKCVEIDRDADRRYKFAMQRAVKAEKEGTFYSGSSPLLEIWGMQNDDEDSHKFHTQIVEIIKKAGNEPGVSPEIKKYVDEVVKAGVPAMGDIVNVTIPATLAHYLHSNFQFVKKILANMEAKEGAEAVEKFKKEKLPALSWEIIEYIVTTYLTARDEVQADADKFQSFFDSQEDIPGRTKADVYKEIWGALEKWSKKPIPAINEELLAELEKMPATIEGEFRHPWGIASKLYRSEAIDAFGTKYLLGVFETEEEAEKAFNDWNAEYEEARAGQKEEFARWSKQEQTKVDADVEAQERIKKVMEEARR